MRIDAMPWIWFVALAMPLPRPALADPPAPVGAEVAASPATGAPAPGQTGTEFRVALLEVPPAPGREQAAAVIITATRAALHEDERFELVATEEVGRARAEHAGSLATITPTELTYAQACIIGRAVNAEHVILLGGYDMGSHTTVKEDSLSNALHQVAEHSTPSRPVERPQIQAWVAASMQVMSTGSCALGEQAVVRANRESHMSEDEALTGARKDFGGAVREGLQRLFPVRSLIRAASDSGGEMTHGARHGVREGQYYEVHRDRAVIGLVHVDAVSEDSARVTLVRGAPRLQPGDHLAESGTVRVWEVGLSATPNLLARHDAGNALGVAAAVHLMLYQPVSSNMYGLMVERLGLPAFSRWRAAIDYGRQLRILPRRLFAYARVGLGVVRASQDLAPETVYRDGVMVTLHDAGVTTGFELLPSLGVKLTLGDGLVLHASASYPVALHGSRWNRASDRKLRVPDDMLAYPHPHRSMPTLTLGAGWRF